MRARLLAGIGLLAAAAAASLLPDRQGPGGDAARPAAMFLGLRPLPYPFEAAVSLADDVDASRWTADMAVKDEMRDRFGLPLGRSMHAFARPEDREGNVAFTNHADGSLSSDIVNGGDFPNSTFHLLRSFHRGEIDYIHGWSDYAGAHWIEGDPGYDPRFREVVLTAAGRLVAQAGEDGRGGSPAAAVLRDEPVHFPGLGLDLTVDERVRGAVLRIRDRRGRSFDACFGAVAAPSACLWSMALPRPGVRTLKAFFLAEDADPAAFARQQPLRYRWDSLQLLVEGAPGARAEAGPVLYSAFNRRLVERQLPVLQGLNIGFWSYSDHGAADNGVSLFHPVPDAQGRPGWYEGDHWAYVDELTGVRVDNWPQAARPESDYHVMDLLGGLGVRFHLFGNDAAGNILGRDRLRGYRLSELLTPVTFPTGRTVYGVRGWFPALSPETGGGEDYAITWNSRFGQVLDYVLAQVDALPAQSEERIFGPIICHLGFEGTRERLGAPPHRIVPGDAFDDRADAALEALAARYYGYGRPGRRIWVASLNRLYRFAQVMQGLDGRVSARADGVVSIARWTDPVTGEVLPTPGREERDLAGVTLYVADSRSVRVEVDGRPLEAFTRNPADATGRQSITFVDLGALRPVADEVWPDTGSAAAVRSGEAPAGGRFLRLEPGRGRIDLALPVPGPARDARSAAQLSFWARSQSGIARLAITYTLADGRRFTARVGPTARPAAEGWSAAWAGPGAWRLYVFPFTQAAFAKGVARAPRGEVTAVSISAAGSGWIDVDQIAFSRDDPFPHPRPTFILSGRVARQADDVTVRARFADGSERVTRTAHDGYFLFQDVPAGAIVRLEAIGAEGSAWYDGGRAVEVESDLAELDIPYGRWPGGYYQTALGGRIAWTSGLVPRNRGEATRRLDLVRSRDGPFRVYEPDALVAWWGKGTLQEYDAYQYANALGFLDRERTPGPGPEGSFNVLLFGDCLFEAAQFAGPDKIGLRLERALAERLRRPVQTPVLADTALSPYHFEALYRAYGRAFRPRLALVALMTSSFQKASPLLTAAANGLEVGAWPDEMLDLDDDGRFFVRPPDPRYFARGRRWDLDWRGGSAHEAPSYADPPAWLAREVERAHRLVAESLRRLRDALAADGVRMVLILTQDRYALSLPRQGRQGGLAYDADLTDAHYRAIAAGLGVPYLNLVRELEKRPDHLQAQWVFDPHWTPLGHRMATEIIVDFLDRGGLLPPPLPEGADGATASR